jgi:hypothetical protein
MDSTLTTHCSQPDNTRRLPIDMAIMSANIPFFHHPKHRRSSTKKLSSQSHPDHILSDWLKEFHANHVAEYLFQVQLLEKLEDQPVEYAGKAWDEKKYPWQTVGKDIVPKQDSFIAVRKAFWEDHCRLGPWHGLKSFQPLRSPNRLRKDVYPASSNFRRKINGRRQINVTDINEIPDGRVY